MNGTVIAGIITIGMQKTSIESIWRLRELEWKRFGKRLWKAFQEDRVTAQSAELSFYFLLAIFPLLIVLTSIFGLLLDSASTLHEAITSYMRAIAPKAVSQLLNDTLNEIASGSSGTKISLGLLGTFWAASNGMAAIIRALNIVYNVEEARPWWKRRIVALVLTVFLWRSLCRPWCFWFTGRRGLTGCRSGLASAPR